MGQTRRPDEILIVDGGSSDGTLEILEALSARYPSIRVLVVPGTNIAEARNIAFENARYEIVASIDGGCTAQRDWLEKLTAALAPDIDVVAGVYVANPRTRWDRVVVQFYYPDPQTVSSDPENPSHRSILIRKRVWLAIGPIPRMLYRSEDKWFNLEARRRGFRFTVARDAIVYWEVRSTLWQVFWNAYIWVKSDIENSVNYTFERNRAIRISLRLDGKLVFVALWLTVFVAWPVAGLLAFPLLLASLVKVSHSMRDVKYAFLYNTVDYVIMVASATGLIQGELTRLVFDRKLSRAPVQIA